MIRRLLLGGLAALMLAGQAMAANVTPVDVDNATPLFSVDSQLFSGSISAAGTIVTLNTTGYGYIEFQFTSAGAGNTVTVESSSDGAPGTGSTFVSSAFFRLDQPNATGLALAGGAGPSVTGSYIAPVTGATMRLRVSSYGSGTVTVAGSQKRGRAPDPLAVLVTGTSASGFADSGNPVKIGCKYNATLPTFTDGQRADCQAGTRGSMNVTIFDPNASSGVTAPIPTDGGTNSVNALKVNGYGELWNGSSWDRARSSQGTDGTGLGVQAVEEGGRSFSEITTATTTAVKSGATTVHTVNVNTCVSGATVKLYNALTASGTPITITCPASTGALPTFTYDAYFGTGLTVVTSGATDVTVTYR